MKTLLGMWIAPALMLAQAPAAAELPKAETVLDRFVEVTGGKAAYEKRKTETQTGSVEFVGQGVKGTITAHAAAPENSYMSMELEGVGRIEQGFAAGVAWEKSALMGPRVKTGGELAQVRRESTFNGPLHWRKLYTKVETVGVEPVNGEDCYKIVLTPAEGKPETDYFSKASGLMVKRVMVANTPLGDIPTETVLSDWKQMGGVLQPGKLVQKAAGQQIAITMDSSKVNEPLPDGIFDLPADIKKLMEKKQ
ncbi:MAG: outer membrane lipoprotein-sorting protein [Bryobacteraceae bacterium]|nr:outer membrane lipoprotein-sorting protein [Bryobacteraceae bacterium]